MSLGMSQSSDAMMMEEGYINECITLHDTDTFYSNTSCFLPSLQPYSQSLTQLALWFHDAQTSFVYKAFFFYLKPAMLFSLFILYTLLFPPFLTARDL